MKRILALALVFFGVGFAQSGKQFITYVQSPSQKYFISLNEEGIDYFIDAQLATVGETSIQLIKLLAVSEKIAIVSCIKYRFLGIQQQSPVYRYTESLVGFDTTKEFFESYKAKDAQSIAKRIYSPCYKDTGEVYGSIDEIVYIPSGIEFFIPGVPGLAKITLSKLLTVVAFDPGK